MLNNFIGDKFFCASFLLIFFFSDIRVQLNDQLKCLDGRLETQQSMVSELQDIFRRRAEIEASYSRDLEALAKHVNKRHKEQKQRWVKPIQEKMNESERAPEKTMTNFMYLFDNFLLTITTNIFPIALKTETLIRFVRILIL